MAFEVLRKTGDLRPVMLRTVMFMRREAGQRLRARGSQNSTGQLRGSLAIGADRTSGWIGSNKPYAAVQQRGHPAIRPKTVKSLAIPLLPRVRRRGIWPRDWNEEADGALFLHKSSTGKAFLARNVKRGKGSVLELVYLLLKKVTVPARPYLLFDGKARQFLRDQLAEHLRKIRK